MAAAIAFAVGILMQPIDGLSNVLTKTAILDFLSTPFVFGIYDEPFTPSVSPQKIHPIVVVFCIGAFLLLCWDLRGNLRALGLVLLALAGWTCIFTFKHAPQIYHAGLMFYVVLAALWIVKDRADISRAGAIKGWKSLKIGTWLFFIMQGLTAFGSLQTLALEFSVPFSGAGDLANYMERIDPRQVIAEYTLGAIESALPYMPGKKVLQLEFGEFRTYGVPRDYLKFPTNQSLLAAALKPASPARPWLLLNLELPSPESLGYQLAYSSPVPPWGLGEEVFWLYCPIGLEHPPFQIGTYDELTLWRGHIYEPFDAKYLLRFMN